MLFRSFAVKKGNEMMLRIVSDGLKALEATGRIDALMAKYGIEKSLRIPVEIRR